MTSFSLTDREFGLLQLSIEVLQQKIAELCLNLFVENDFEKLITTLRTNKAGVINPSIDPRRHAIGPEDFWLNVTDQNGRTVACIAARIYETDNFTDLVSSGQLFDRNGLEAFVGDEPVEVLETSRRIKGKVNYAAGLWVDNRWRRKGLSLVLPYLSRSLAIRNYGADYSCGYHLSSLALSRLPIDIYGYAHQELTYKGYYPPASGYEEMHLGYVDIEESLDRIRSLPEHEIYPISMSRTPDLDIIDPLPMAATA